MRKHYEKLENLPEDFGLEIISADARFMRSMCEGQFFITAPNVKLEGYGGTSLCREYTLHREDKRIRPKRIIQGNSKIGLVLDVLVTRHFGHYAIEVKIVSIIEDVTQSWVVISRGLAKYVTELALNQQILHTELSMNTARSAVTFQALEPPQVSSLVPATAILPINQVNHP